MGYELIWEPRGVVKRFYGQVTDFEISSSVARIHGDERLDGLRYIICDFVDGTERLVTPAAIDEIAAIEDTVSISNPHLRIGLVAATPDFIALVNQYAYSTPKTCPTRAFSSLAEARLWLDAIVSPAESLGA